MKYYIPTVVGLTKKNSFIDKATITLSTPIENMEIYYTRDGRTPIKAALQQWVALRKGWHPLIIKFHEATGGSELTLLGLPHQIAKKNTN
ncbi:MAG: chitobiase/beta-hexosaminidase C-terminal domain-containing protein [Bacteroidetes bacterium]|nr:chitobiase/beta-hexosaminidase C-terminal domain-containing protein [Bacteroidota bacterium]